MANESTKGATAEQKMALLALERSSLDVKTIAKLFGYTTTRNIENGLIRKEPYFKTSARLFLKAGEYINTTDVNTNVGIFLFNKLLIEGTVSEFIPGGYYNTVVTKKEFVKLTRYISTAIMDGKLSLDPNDDTRVFDFLKAYEFWGLRLPAIFSPGYTLRMIKPNPEVSKLKMELIKSKPSSVEDMTKIEDTLVSLAKKKTSGDPGRSIFDSGSRGSFENDYKNMSIMVGGIKSPIDNSYELMTSNYVDGISKEDINLAGNIVVNSEYPKAVGTQRGGYITKQFYAAFQGISLDAPKTDCGTKIGLPVVLTEDNASDYFDQYIMQGGKNILLTPSNYTDFVGKRVVFRSPMFCLSEKRCNICMGERYYKIGIPSMGLTAARISNNLLTKNLKLKHNMKIQLNHVDTDSVLVASPVKITTLGTVVDKLEDGEF